MRLALVCSLLLGCAKAHTMLVCSATSCNTPGRVTVFLGTYHNGELIPSSEQHRARVCERGKHGGA